MTAFVNEHNETLTFIVQHQRNANAVIYDILVKNTALTQAEMDILVAELAPVGYSPMIKLLPGNYDYKDAIVGVRVSSNVVGDIGGINGLILNVDVADILDRGLKNISSQATTSITFNRTFNIIPEVLVTVIAGSNPTIAEIENISKTGFDVTLYLSADDTVTTGDISWQAIGY